MPLNPLSICLLLFLTLFKQGFSQTDTNYIALTHFSINFEDSAEHLTALIFSNKTNALTFYNSEDCKQIGIHKNDICNLVIRTNKSSITIPNINEFLFLKGFEHRMRINCPKNHTDCFFGEFLLSDYSTTFHTHTLSNRDLLADKICIEVYAETTGNPAKTFLHILE